MANLVKPIDEMDDTVLILHMNGRHMPMAGLAAVVPRPSDSGEKLLRAYHDRVHKIGLEDRPARPVNHQHRES